MTNPWGVCAQDEAAKAEQCLREGEEALKGTKAKLASKLEGNADLLNKVKDYDEKSENLLKEQARLAEEQARLATQKRELNNELRVNATEVEILVNLKDKQVDAVKKCMQICGVKPLLQATAEGAIRVAISTFKDFEMVSTSPHTAPPYPAPPRLALPCPALPRPASPRAALPSAPSLTPPRRHDAALRRTRRKSRSSRSARRSSRPAR